MAAEPNGAAAPNLVPLIAPTVALGIALAGFYKDRIQKYLRSNPLFLEVGRTEPLYQRTSTSPLKFIVRVAVQSRSDMQEKSVSILLADHRVNGLRKTGFVPIRLKWTHRNNPVLEALAPRQCAYVDLGIITMSSHTGGPFRMTLCTEVLPENGAHIVHPGASHTMELHAVTEDGISSRTAIQLSFWGSPFEASVRGFPPSDSGLSITRIELPISIV